MTEEQIKERIQELEGEIAELKDQIENFEHYVNQAFESLKKIV